MYNSLLARKQINWLPKNPDYSGKDLYDAIANGKPVEYGLYVQLMDPKDEAHLSYDPLDDTKNMG